MICNDPDDVLPLSVLAHHYETGERGISAFEVEEAARSKALHLSAGVFARYQTVWSSPPLKWFRMVDPRTPMSEVDALVEEFLSADRCDIDDTFTAYVRSA
eukprot:13910780-Alexandrium_andersonii.AAC.1